MTVFAVERSLKLKILTVAILSAVLLISLSACGNSFGGSSAQNQSPSIPTKKFHYTSESDQSSTGTNQNSSTSIKNIRSTNKDNQAVNRPTGAWVDTFEKELYKGYRVTPSRYKNIGNGNWEVWVKEADTGNNPYVTVNQNTGDFHG